MWETLVIETFVKRVVIPEMRVKQGWEFEHPCMVSLTTIRESESIIICCSPLSMEISRLWRIAQSLACTMEHGPRLSKKFQKKLHEAPSHNTTTSSLIARVLDCRIRNDFNRAYRRWTPAHDRWGMTVIRGPRDF